MTQFVSHAQLDIEKCLNRIQLNLLGILFIIVNSIRVNLNLTIEIPFKIGFYAISKYFTQLEIIQITKLLMFWKYLISS